MKRNINKFTSGTMQPLGAKPNHPSINIDLKSLPDVNCVKCGYGLFEMKWAYKLASPLQSPTGKDIFVNREVPVCAKCGHLLLMDEIKSKMEEESTDTVKPEGEVG